MGKKITKRFVQAVFRRGKEDYLPLHYITAQMGKVVDDEEMANLKPALDQMIADGEVEEKGDTYKLLKEVSEA